MRRNRLNWIASWLPFLLALLMGMTETQTSGDIQLQIRLRNSDGTAVVSETIILQRLPEEEAITPAFRQAQGDNCITDANGECTWYVGRGLYQVLFTRPLDDISALAVADGGLSGFGITVGEEDIVYHFTFHSDGRVYFDAAPEAVVPFPIIPSPNALYGGTEPTPVVDDEPVEETPTPEPTNAPDTAAGNTSGRSWPLILFIGGGLAMGGGLHLWSRKKRPSAPKTNRQKDQATNRPTDQATNRPTDQETKNA